jgi:hypothetical protein
MRRCCRLHEEPNPDPSNSLKNWKKQKEDYGSWVNRLCQRLKVVAKS